MIRLLGFLVGSLLVLTVWWVLKPASSMPSSGNPIVPLRPAMLEISASGAVPAPVTDMNVAGAGGEQQVSPEPVPTGEPNEAPALPTEVVALESPPLQEIRIQPVWSAFRNRPAAQGFADRLSQLSGENFTVRRAGLFEFRVELAYTDPLAKDAVLAALEQRTGMKLVESAP
ncbi:MAG: hypothetical protein KDH88_04890 [Chromatiales bacterium]|nr:hypothetical protein [Chromatiales bacterium]